jgi:hypothetical protein
VGSRPPLVRQKDGYPPLRAKLPFGIGDLAQNCRLVTAPRPGQTSSHLWPPTAKNRFANGDRHRFLSCTKGPSPITLPPHRVRRHSTDQERSGSSPNFSVHKITYTCQGEMADFSALIPQDHLRMHAIYPDGPSRTSRLSPVRPAVDTGSSGPTLRSGWTEFAECTNGAGSPATPRPHQDCGQPVAAARHHFAAGCPESPGHASGIHLTLLLP